MDSWDMQEITAHWKRTGGRVRLIGLQEFPYAEGSGGGSVGCLSMDFETYFRCMCKALIEGARPGSRFVCLACGRTWH